MRPWHQPHPEDAAIDAMREELQQRRMSQPAEVNAAEDALTKARCNLNNAEVQLRICRRLGHDDTLALLAVETAQAAVMVAGDLLIEALDVAAGRSERAA